MTILHLLVNMRVGEIKLLDAQMSALVAASHSVACYRQEARDAADRLELMCNSEVAKGITKEDHYAKNHRIDRSRCCQA